MKPGLKIKTVLIVGVFVILIGTLISSKILLDKSTELKSNVNNSELLLSNNIFQEEKEKSISLINNVENTVTNVDPQVEGVVEEVSEEAEIQDDENIEEVVYDGMTLAELSYKLDRSLNSTISGYGNLFATYSLSLGLDPYLAVAIVLHETGCSWECSELVKQCNNVGGMKGNPGCMGGSYASFATLEDGIISYLNNLYNNYYAIGLTTPDTIGPRYAASPVWANKINWYIEKIKQA